MVLLIMTLLFLLVAAFLITSCDDARDLTLPAGQSPDAPIAVIWREGRTDTVSLAWTKVPRAEGYHVYSAPESDGRFERVASVRDTATQFTIIGTDLRFFYVTSVVDSVESIGSGQVGYTTIVVTGGESSAVTQFGFALTAWRRGENGVPIPRTTSTLPKDILLNQISPGDEASADVLADRDDMSLIAFQTVNGQWEGALAEQGIITWHGYRLLNRSHVTYTLVSCGRVDNGYSGEVWFNGSGQECVQFVTNYTWKESRRVPIGQLGLIEAGFAGNVNPTCTDRITRIDGGASAFHVDGVWHGGLTNLEPGRTYVIQRKRPEGFHYTYTAPE